MSTALRPDADARELLALHRARIESNPTPLAVREGETPGEHLRNALGILDAIDIAAVDPRDVAHDVRVRIERALWLMAEPTGCRAPDPYLTPETREALQRHAENLILGIARNMAVCEQLGHRLNEEIRDVMQLAGGDR